MVKEEMLNFLKNKNYVVGNLKNTKFYKNSFNFLLFFGKSYGVDFKEIKSENFLFGLLRTIQFQS